MCCNTCPVVCHWLGSMQLPFLARLQHQAAEAPVFPPIRQRRNGLCDVAGEDSRDVRESLVKATGEELHASDRTEGDQSNDERVLDEVLAWPLFSINIFAATYILIIRSSPFVILNLAFRFQK